MKTILAITGMPAIILGWGITIAVICGIAKLVIMIKDEVKNAFRKAYGRDATYDEMLAYTVTAIGACLIAGHIANKVIDAVIKKDP